MKKYILFLFLGILLIGACKKQLVDKYQKAKEDETAKSTTGIKAASSFKWNTFKPMTFTYAGIPDDVRVAVIKISGPDGTTLFQKLQKANSSFSVTLDIPVHYETIEVSFGSSRKAFETQSSSVDVFLN